MNKIEFENYENERIIEYIECYFATTKLHQLANKQNLLNAISVLKQRNVKYNRMIVRLELEVNGGEWEDDMTIFCKDFEKLEDGRLLVDGAIFVLPSITRILEVKIIHLDDL